MASYFSDRESGERPRDQEMITETVWRAIYHHIKDHCSANESFWAKAKGDIPGLERYVAWKRDYDSRDNTFDEYSVCLYPGDTDANIRSPIEILELIEFACRQISSNSDYYKINPFREAINTIFRRNGLAFELSEEGEIHRLSSEILLNPLMHSTFATGDDDLNRYLTAARTKFLDPDEEVRRDALKELWDAFERLKTIESGDDKKERTNALLDRMAKRPTFRQRLEEECRTLTCLGNMHQIRHSETTQEQIQSSEHVEYLFCRCSAFIWLALRTTNRGA